MDRFDDMVVFGIIARTGTISAAASELGVAPSAVSRRLKALEERLGVELVKRTTRNLHLTPAGEEYLDGARHILGEVETLEGALQAGAGTLSGPIRLTAPMSFGLQVLPEKLDTFMRQHPDVRLDLHLSDEHVDLVAEGFDLALRIGILQNSALIARRLCEIDFVVAASQKFLDQYPKLESPADLAGLPGCIYSGVPQSNTIQWTSPDGSENQVALTPIVRANNGDILRDLAMRGHGLVCGPRFIVESGLRDGDLIELFGGYAWPHASLYAVYPPTAHISARLRALIDYFAVTLRKDECA